MRKKKEKKSYAFLLRVYLSLDIMNESSLLKLDSDSAPQMINTVLSMHSVTQSQWLQGSQCYRKYKYQNSIIKAEVKKPAETYYLTVYNKHMNIYENNVSHMNTISLHDL